MRRFSDSCDFDGGCGCAGHGGRGGFGVRGQEPCRISRVPSRWTCRAGARDSAGTSAAAAAFGGAFGGPGGPGRGGPGGPGGGGILASNVLAPAASFLGISVSTLTSDLAGGKTLAQEAVTKGKTAADLITAIVADETTNLDNEKAAGWITAAQETALVSQLTDQVTALVNNGPPVPPSGGGRRAASCRLAATFLGLSVSDLQTALKGGKTLADEATAQGKNASDLVTALEAPAKANLDQAVTAGKITQAQENTILANLTTRLTNLVNGTKPSTATMNSVRKALLKYSTLKRFGTRR